MFTKKELKIALDYFINTLAYYIELKKIPLSEDLEVLYCLVEDEISGEYSPIPIDRMKSAIKFTFAKVLKTYGIVPTWLQVSHILLVDRLQKELDGKED